MGRGALWALRDDLTAPRHHMEVGWAVLGGSLGDHAAMTTSLALWGRGENSVHENL